MPLKVQHLNPFFLTKFLFSCFESKWNTNSPIRPKQMKIRAARKNTNENIHKVFCSKIPPESPAKKK
tara:strand:- start:153 stop:353 length:201 start_codon:yes stop_codon:yes gene_type:complete